VNLPRLGTYTYDLSGRTQSPVLGLAQNYPAGAVLSVDFLERSPPGPGQGAGTEVTARATSPQDQAQNTTRWVWEPSKVLLTFSNLTFAGLASYDCTYAPPPEILPIPIRAGALPAQSWSGSQCSGNIQVTVLGAEAVSAADRNWDAWRIHTVLHYAAQSSVDVTTDTTSLFSPELGTAVTAHATTSRKVAGQAFSAHQVTRLTSHP